MTLTRIFSRGFLPGISGEFDITDKITDQILDLIGPQVSDGHICRLKETHVLLIPEPEHCLPQAELDVRDLNEEQLPLPPGLPQRRAGLPGNW